MKIVMNRNEFCKLDFHIRIIEKQINLSFCCNDYSKVPMIPLNLFIENPKKYLDNFFVPFHVHDRYEGHCFRNDTDMCNRYVDVYNKGNVEVQVDIDTLTKCKANCYHCIKLKCGSGLSINEETQLTKMILDVLKEYTFIDILQMTSNGDASLYDLVDIVKHCPKHIKQFKILSNGYNIENLVNLEKNHGKCPIEYWIPLPSMKKEIYTSIYQTDNYDRLMDYLNMDHLIPITIHYIAYEEGMDEVFDIANFCKKRNFTMAIIPDFHSKISHKWVYELLQSGKLPRSEKVLYAIKS